MSFSTIKSILIGGLFMAFVGETGCGKTCTMTWYAYWINKRIREGKLPVKLYANYHLNHIPEKGLIWEYEYLEHPEQVLEVSEGFLLLDELWGWCLDSYETKRKAQKQYDKLMGRGRKRGLAVLASSQRFMRLDPNFRFNVHYLILPYMTLLNGLPYRITVYTVNNQTDEIEGKPFVINPNPIFPMYDTREEIKTMDEYKQMDFRKLAKEFWVWNDRNQRCTQGLVNLFLHESNLKQKLSREECKMVYVACLREMEKYQ